MQQQFISFQVDLPQQILYMTEKLLYSRKQKEETHERLGNISPEKYGKGAYCDLTYTPSKLADNVLFREASNLKKIQEESSKSRSLQAQNQILNDQVSYLKKERDGISGSLNQIIAMYKTIIAEMQAKSQQRIKDSQKKWNEEIQRYIKDKEEEARYFQSQKEILEERIQQLECTVQTLTDQLQESRSLRADIGRQVEGLQIDKKNLQDKNAALQKKGQQDAHRAKNEYDNLKKQSMHAEVEAKNHLNEEMRKKEKQIETIQRSHRAEVQKIQATRRNETILKNQEINQITRTFEGETNRLKQILGVKDKMIQNLSIQNNKQKNRILNLTRDYQNQINHLTHEKNRLIDQIQNLGKDNQYLTKDKVMLTGDLERQNNNLRELLMESSVELERCKNQFMILAKENSMLLGKLKGAEEQAKTWRDSYYMNKTRPY